ncbi:putative Nudix hydrolase [Lentzea pudingi]|uniref:Nudix hydrolase n=1 Tax=Lentzea pudingi TaxID=1789439 RepID=A0ABQ2IS57_9PSEU|nr:NUDIX domain-containing protein [Lentzea pudingi]GGN19946.1 putative Nudix hydrolase [Lentzea pudingi]
MADELIDIYDENLNLQGTEMKSVAHRTGLWHKSIHCWIIRGGDGGSVLFQKRSAEKELFPNALDISAAGHYQSGESVSDGVREIVEELGLDVPFEKLIPLGIKIDLGLAPGILNREFCETFLLREDKPIESYSPAPDEVEGLVEVSIAEGLQLFSKTSSRSTATARGIEYRSDSQSWASIEYEVPLEDFIPRVDSYYYKIFIMADLMLKGYSHLAI